MTALVLIYIILFAVPAVPQGNYQPLHTGTSFDKGRCGPGQLRHVNGRCVTPRVSRRVYLFEVPAPPPPSHIPPPHIPEPTVEVTDMLIKIPERGHSPPPIIVPPPKQRDVLYVLNKQSQQDQRVIEVPAPPSFNHEVYFVDYADGDNPVLPSGFDLAEALRVASPQHAPLVGGGVSDLHRNSESGGSGLFAGEETFSNIFPGKFSLDFDDTDFPVNEIPSISSLADLDSRLTAILDGHDDNTFDHDQFLTDGGSPGNNEIYDTTFDIEFDFENNKFAVHDPSKIVRAPAPIPISPPASIDYPE
ncbi:uncharacterized protein LOC134770914 [Penaeus indicus]|uniref:uncharacterized protein LOC134770914 n=1 Tax=Penaeus indicus TaxID=29960 RepID=UPI00300C4FB0